MITLASLLTRPTRAEIVAQLTEYLGGLGFETTNWIPGSWQMHTLQLPAIAVESLAVAVSEIAAAGFVSLAVDVSDDWTTLTAREVYQVERRPAVRAAGVMVFTSSPAAPAHTIDPGALIATAASAPAQTYRPIEGTSEALAPGGTVSVAVEAVDAGSAGNIPTGSTLFLWTPLVGVTVTNPTIPSLSSWLTNVGADEESSADLAIRAMARWNTLSYGATEGAYGAWVVEADHTVTRWRVMLGGQSGNPGEVDIILASDAGPAVPAQVERVRAYIYGETDGKGRRPINDEVTVRAATPQVVAGNVTVTVDAAYQDVTTAQRVIETMEQYVRELPIGGVVIPPAAQGVAVTAEAVAMVMALPGVIDVDAGGGGNAVFATLDSVLVVAWAVTMVYV